MRPTRFALALVRLLAARGLRLSTAESLTGGLIGAAITSIPGSSRVYWGGFVTYDVAAKECSLGVSRDLVERHGVVSREVAEAMASGAASRSGADISVAVTGVAGPGGAEPNAPVGTVWMAVAISSEGRPLALVSASRRFRGSRARVRDRTVRAAVDLVAEVVQRDFPVCDRPAGDSARGA